METLEIDFMTPKIFFIDKDIYIYIYFTFTTTRSYVSIKDFTLKSEWWIIPRNDFAM